MYEKQIIGMISVPANTTLSELRTNNEFSACIQNELKNISYVFLKEKYPVVNEKNEIRYICTPSYEIYITGMPVNLI